MKKIVLALGFFLVSALMVHAAWIIKRPSAGGAPTCDLLEDQFENTDGVDSTTHGWTASGTDPGDFVEIDTAQFQVGASSMLVNNDANSTSYFVYKDLSSSQSSGTFTVDFYWRTDSVSGGGFVDFLLFGNNSTTQGISNDTFRMRRAGTNIERLVGNTWATVCSGPCVSINTWHHIELEVNQTAHTFDMWLDDSLVGDDVGFRANVATGRIYIQKESSSNSDSDMWFDALCIYSGPRQ